MKIPYDRQYTLRLYVVVPCLPVHQHCQCAVSILAVPPIPVYAKRVIGHYADTLATHSDINLITHFAVIVSVFVSTLLLLYPIVVVGLQGP